MIIKTERQKITDKNQTKKIKELEELYKEYELSFGYKTVYFKTYENGSKYYSKTYYEISVLNDDKEEIEIIKFYAKRGYPTLHMYLEKAFRTGGDEEE